jgi:HEXXH motif-containing protein
VLPATTQADEDALVKVLLRPGPGPVLADLRARHRRADVAVLDGLIAGCRSSPNPSDAALAPMLTVLADEIDDVPACGGLHGQGDARALAAASGGLCERAMHEGTRCEGVVPDAVDFSLPRSGLTVVLPERLRLRYAVAEGGIVLQGPDGELARLRRTPPGDVELVAVAPGVRALHRIDAAGLSVEAGLQRFGEQLPPGAAVLDRPLTPDEHERLQVAVGLLRVVAPQLYVEMVEEKVRLVPLAPRPGLLRQSCSFRTAPGLVFLNLADPVEILDLLCHEYHHLKLFRVQEHTTLLERPETPVVAPWRADRRTAEGLLHGTYVFFMCAWLLDALFAQFAPSVRGRTRQLVFRVCVEAALAELDRVAPGLTPVGGLLVDAMATGNAAALATLPVTDERTAWARRTVTDHLARAGGPDRSEPWFLGL